MEQGCRVNRRVKEGRGRDYRFNWLKGKVEGDLEKEKEEPGNEMEEKKHPLHKTGAAAESGE